MLTVGVVLALWLTFRHRVDIWVAQSPYEGCVAVIAKLCGRVVGRRVIVIVESHGDFEIAPLLLRRHRFAKARREVLRVLARFALRHADLLRAVSDATRAQLERWVNGKPVCQFIAWTQLDLFLAAGCAKRWHDVPEIVYVGVVSRAKGLHHLLNAFISLAREYPQSRLVIVGPVYDKHYSDELRQRAEVTGLSDRVHFVGELEQEEVAQRMASATVFVLPSLTEGFGRVVLEAMATGTPIVASAVGGIPEILTDGVEGFLVEPGEEEVLTARLRWICEHRTAACEMGRRGRQSVVGRFSSVDFKRSYGALFEAAERELVKGPHQAL
jgi:glycosyltransferase involved in cell wall biosynthesis